MAAVGRVVSRWRWWCEQEETGRGVESEEEKGGRGRRRRARDRGEEEEEEEERRAGPSWAALAERSICVVARHPRTPTRMRERGRDWKCLRAAAAAAEATRPAASGSSRAGLDSEPAGQRAGSRRAVGEWVSG